MKLHIGKFFSSRPFTLLVLSAIVVNAGLWAFLLLRRTPDTDILPLHYNIYFGIDFVGPWWYLLAFPAIGAIVWLVNSILALVFARREPTVSYFLLAASVFVQLLLALVVIFSVRQI